MEGNLWKTDFHTVVVLIGGVPTTVTPNTSAKVSLYKWDPHRDASW